MKTQDVSTPLLSTGRVRTLHCACCGEQCRGRQWWNRDTGYGVCASCVDRQLAGKLGKAATQEEIRDNYGVRGVHYDVQERP